MDKIICEMIMKHPYVANSMELNISVMWTDGKISGYYHIFDFNNDNFDKQERGSLGIKFEY